MKKFLCMIEKENIDLEYDETIEIDSNNKINFTFFKESKKIKFKNFFSNEGLDLFYISLFVFISDRLIKRDISEDGWTRNLKLLIPVLEKNKWDDKKEDLIKILNFLSGDLWEIEFRERNLTSKEKLFKKNMSRNNKIPLKNTDFAMFSGGLDSYIGAIDFLESKKNILFISHYGSGKGVIEYQNKLSQKLKDNYPEIDNNFLQYHVSAIGGKEDTTRTRSFMFFTHAILLASTIKDKTRLYIPENGLISLNIPMTSARLGSSSTRTTHPYYLQNLQNLLTNLNINVEIINPYQFKTKGEMILNCKNQDLLKDTLVDTMSCSHPDHGRYRGESKAMHCGNCLPCIIRRAAIKKGLEIDNTLYFDEKLKSGKNSNYNLKAYNLGISKFNNSKLNAKFIIQKSGPITKNLDDFSNLYKRGIKELEDLLEDINE